MDGSDDVRPEIRRHVPDPSLEQMLQRARDAHLGDEHDTVTTEMRRALASRHGWRTDLTLLLVGVLIGVFGTITVAPVRVTISSARLSAPTVSQTMPTATTTPTDTPTLSDAPSSEQIITAIQIYYDQWGPFAGTYLLMNGPTLQIQSQDATEVDFCVAYNYADVVTPDVVAGSDIRRFTLILTSGGAWQVSGMNYSGSCGLG